MQESLKTSSFKGSRSYSTSTPRRAEAMIHPDSAEVQNQGHIFGLPELPLPSTSHLKHRYDPVVHQVTNLLMEDGKLSKAQRVRSSVPLFVRRSAGNHNRLKEGANMKLLSEHGNDTRTSADRCSAHIRPSTSSHTWRSSCQPSPSQSNTLPYTCY